MYAQPTIKDVAKLAGVHFTTVSMALRGHPSIPAPTRDRILAAASRIGYKRNQVFAALTNQRRSAAATYYTPRVAYLTNRSEAEGLLKLAHHRSMLEGARKEAEALGYTLELLSIGEGGLDPEHLLTALRERSISGIILGALEPGRPLPELPWAEFSVVKIDSLHAQPECPHVSTDQLAGVRDAFREMQAKGYRRIGLAVGVDDEEATDHMHLSGWELEQFALPAQERIPPLLLSRGCSEKRGAQQLRPYIEQHRLDAVLCNYASIRGMLTSAGIDCPGQVACANLCISRPHPTLAGIVANMDLVGRRVMALLGGLLRSEHKGATPSAIHTYVKGIWHDGSSAPHRN